MEVLRRNPLRSLLIAVALATGAALLVAADADFGLVSERLQHFRPPWLAVVLGGQLLAFAGYSLAYRSIITALDGPRLSLRLVVQLVATGFGAFAPGGGFALDYSAVRELEQDERAASVRVLALGALEYAVIAPVACIASIAMLLIGSEVMGSVLWPWALAVPIGFVIGFWLAARYERAEPGNDGRRWRVLGDAMEGVNLIRRMATHPLRFAPALLGVAVYWSGEVLSLWGAVRAFDAALAVGPLVVGLATGYALTRRSMPFAGAGITEALLSFALLWVGLDLASAVAATVLYRLFSFVVPMAPGLWARREVVHLIHPELATETAPGAGAGERSSSA